MGIEEDEYLIRYDASCVGIAEGHPVHMNTKRDANTEVADRPAQVLFIGPRLHPNYSDFLREVAKETTVKVVVSTTFPNDDTVGLDCVIFPPSRLNSIRARAKTTDAKSQRFYYRNNSPSLFWLIRFMRTHQINTVIARRNNQALLVKAKIASLVVSAKFKTFSQQILTVGSAARNAIFALKESALDPEQHRNFIPLGISLSCTQIASTPPAPKGQAEGLRLISVGKFVERKGHRLAIEAVALIADELSVKLDIFGGYSGMEKMHKQELEGLIARLGLEHLIELKPPVSRTEMLSIYPKYDAYLYAGWVSTRVSTPKESYGRAVGANGTMLYSMIEALSVGLSVICSSEKKAVGSVHDGLNGFVFDKGDVVDLARKMTLMAQADKRKMGAESIRLCCAHHSARFAADRFLRLVTH